MAEQTVESLDTSEDVVPLEPAELPREPTEYEKRLRRDLARTREQVRIAQSERDAHVAAAVRDRDDAIASIRTDAAERIMRSELKAHALAAGIVDIDGLRLADTTTLSLADDGTVQGAAALIETLRQTKPYLFTDVRAAVSTGTTGQTLRPPAPAGPSNVDARTLSREAWQAERDRLLAIRQ